MAASAVDVPAPEFPVRHCLAPVVVGMDCSPPLPTPRLFQGNTCERLLRYSVKPSARVRQAKIEMESSVAYLSPCIGQ
jgi:hypothetical protein